MIGQLAPFLIDRGFERALRLSGDQAFQSVMGFDQDDGRRALVVFADFEAEHAVFHDVDAPYPVASGDLFHGLDKLQRRHGFAVHRDGSAFFEADGDFLGFVGGRSGLAVHWKISSGGA